jgi:2-polyprenyl-6-methoxyphenol hydroxylase-like FAD-dependent oxidoreductase
LDIPFIFNRIGCLDLLKKRGERLKSVLSRNSDGNVLLKLDVDASVKGKVPNALCELTSEGIYGEPMVYSIMRDALQQVLYEATQTRYTPITEDEVAGEIELSNTAVTIKGGKQCVQAEEDEKKGTVTLTFADGSKEGDFDVVFGADGISSVLRQYTKTGDQSLLYPLDLKVFNPEGIDLTTPRKNRCADAICAVLTLTL